MREEKCVCVCLFVCCVCVSVCLCVCGDGEGGVAWAWRGFTAWASWWFVSGNIIGVVLVGSDGWLVAAGKMSGLAGE